MDNLFERFVRKLGIEDVLMYDTCYFASKKYDKEKDLLTIEIEQTGFFTYKAARTLLDAIDHAPFKVQVNFKYRNGFTENQLYELLKDEFINRTGLDETSMPKYKFDNSNGEKKITFIFYGNAHEESFEPVISLWEQLLVDLQIDVDIDTKIVYTGEEIQKRNQEIQAVLPQIKQTYETSLKTQYETTNYSQRQRGNYVDIKIKDINENSGNVRIIGKIFQAESRVTKKGKTMATYYVYDKTSSIEVIAFENNRGFKPEILEQLAKDMPAVEIKGVASVSQYTNEIQIKADSIIINEEFSLEDKTEDTSTEKRVELHLHTKMSTMDAVSTITDYAAQAKKWGWRAIGVTDHGNVQAYPEAQKAAEKYGLKMLYGSELYMVDEQLEYVFNPSDIPLNKATYVVFDFETTGLSARYDRIIEFGAVKFKDGMIVDNMDMFIDPEIDLPEFIIEKTHITNAMVRGKTKIKQALKIMREFIGDSILVAHNASFDYGFLNEAFKNNGEEEMLNPVIDTLALAWYMFPNAKSHSLGGLCRQFSVEYDDTSAHRANYDAEVLNNAFQAMLARLTKDNINLTHAQLMDLKNDQILKNARVKHVVAYAKNKQGLKDLFKIISKSCTEYFSQVPRVPRHLLEEYRENLLLGSACFNGEVFDAAMTRSKEVLKKKISFYDYIEVQPLPNYSFLINDGQISSNEKVKNILKDIIEASEEMNKLVVATSDAHYCRPAQKEFRDVYIYAKAVGGTRHPLNPNRRDRQKHYENPDQHLRSTDEMLNEFSFLGEEKAKEIVITNTNKICDMIDELYPIHKDTYPPSIKDCDKILIDRVYSKAHEWYGDPLPELIDDRLKAELNGIIKHGYAVQFYIASEIVRRANQDGYIVGSRGSVGSSFVATMADITEVNALPPHYRCPHCKHFELVNDPNIKSGYDLPDKNCPKCGHKMIQDGQNLPFAIFLGFNAEKVPDIDLNFPGDYQGRAHLLTKEFLGDSGNQAFRAGTIETVAEKTAYGYVLGYFETCYKMTDEQIRKIPNAEKTRIALGCQDVKRTTGQHPGGIIVIPAGYEVYDFTPYQYPADDLNATWFTTHFDFHAIHDNVLKLDLLGHVDPIALKFLENITGIKPTEIPLNDMVVDSIFGSREALKCSSNYMNETTGALGLPEFGTSLTRQMLEEIRPKTFADLVLISGLSHGTDVWAGNAQDLLRNKICGVDGIIACRDDVMLYLIAHGVNNSVAFKTMESVRKGKKIPKDYMEEIVKCGVPEYYIESANKCKYLFPKAHAIAYVTMAVRIAWFKVHKPLAYYACFFSTRAKQFDLKAMTGGTQAIINTLENIKNKKMKKIQTPKDEEIEKTLHIALEMYERGYKISNIDLYKSDATKFVVDEVSNSVIAPFTVIDGLGEGPAQSVVEARTRPFVSQEDLAVRTKLNSQNIENLRKLKVLDNLPEEDQVRLF